MEALAYELRRKKGCQVEKVTAHVLCPGRVETNMLMGVDENRVPHYAEELSRIADPEERTRKEQEWKRLARERVAGAMGPDEMSEVLLEAVGVGRFYVLGW